jgi:nitrate reductase beta subunit
VAKADKADFAYARLDASQPTIASLARQIPR